MRSSASLAIDEPFAACTSKNLRLACSLDDAISGEQLFESGIAVGVDDAGELFQMGTRMFALAIRRVEEQCCRWAGAANGRSSRT